VRLDRNERPKLTYVLSKVPGNPITEKAETIGVSRQTYYYWTQGQSRPSLPQAERLAALTGIPVGDIRTRG
jgi:transcriptional regulator with XRE-family HTH domain